MRGVAGAITGNVWLLAMSSMASCGGSFANFAVGIGVGIGFAAGMVAGAAEDALFGSGFYAGIKAGTAKLGEIALYSAMAGTAAGAISSVIYGQNTEKSLARGAAYGAITGAVVSFGQSVIKELVNVIKVDVDGIQVGILDASTVRKAFSNLKAKEPRMAKFLADFKGKGLKIKLFDKQNAYYQLSNKTISWNPKMKDMGLPDAWSKIHPEVVLGHELVHAHHFLVEGLQGVNPPAIPNAINIGHILEYRAVGLGPWAGNGFISENTLRQAYGNHVPRTSYNTGGFPY